MGQGLNGTLTRLRREQAKLTKLAKMERAKLKIIAEAKMERMKLRKEINALRLETSKNILPKIRRFVKDPENRKRAKAAVIASKRAFLGFQKFADKVDKLPKVTPFKKGKKGDLFI